MGNIRLYGSTSGYTELAPPAVAPDGVLSLPSGTGTLAKETGAWNSWTPTAGNYSVGNGSLTSRYMQMGKSVHFQFALVFGTTTSISGDFNFSLPVARSASYYSTAYSILSVNGLVDYMGQVVMSNSLCYVRCVNTSSTHAYAQVLSSTVPATWSDNDQIIVNGTYEAA
jgi:hypothetical protein